MWFDRSWHILRLGLKSIAVHRLRSILTVMGIVLGVASVIVMLALGEAARFQAIQQIKDLGAENVIIRSVKPMEELKGNTSDMLAYGITRADVERIQETIPTVTTINPMREFRKEIRFLDRKLEGRVVAVMPTFLEMNGLKLSRGRFVSALDHERFSNVVVLAAETAQTLFPVEDPIGHSVRVGESHYYRVIGVTETRAPSAGIGSSMAAQDYNRDVYIPFNTDRVRFGPMVISSRPGSFQAEEVEISQITVGVNNLEAVEQTADIIQGLFDQYHARKDVAITVPKDLLKKAEETQRFYRRVLVAIASASLIVGGIGIMNIMLATVTERTREIGIRRALGAKKRDIAAQFLVETVMLSSTGGVLGVLLGLGLCFVGTQYSGIQAIIQPWSPVLAFAVSVAVGLIFGTYPARRAANLDPIEALRHE